MKSQIPTEPDLGAPPLSGQSSGLHWRPRWSAAWGLCLLLAFLPYSGRWLMLAVVLPAIVVVLFYRSHRLSAGQMALATPVGGWTRCWLKAGGWAIVLWAFKAFVVQPLLALWFADSKDLTLFDPIKGNVVTLLVFLAFMWLIAAFGEEFVWRGFLLRTAGEWFVAKFPQARIGWPLAIVACALLWGLTHAYQGPRGVVEKLIGGTILGAIYLSGGRSSLWLVVIIHGLGNTISFVAIYFDAYYTIFPFA